MDPAPHLRHQSSLETIIDSVAAEPRLEAGQSLRAEEEFYRIVQHFEDTGDETTKSKTYNRPALVRLTYQHSLSDESKEKLLRAFFHGIGISIDASPVDLRDSQKESEVRSGLFGFADYLFSNLFLPMRASGTYTPNPSPGYHEAIRRVQNGNFVGTPERLSELRSLCLERDRHRCVISRQFDEREAVIRFERYGGDARDDDGNDLNEEPSFEPLEAAHILPHSLTKIEGDSELSRSKKAALAILNVFDHGIINLLEGPDIDRPRNAMMLSYRLHMQFGRFKILFEPIPDQEHTYRIHSLLPTPVLRNFPMTRSLYLAEHRNIDPPSPRFLAIHRAIARILHLSAAGGYIDKIFRDKEEKLIRADGSTELGRLVTLGLDGWLGKISASA